MGSSIEEKGRVYHRIQGHFIPGRVSKSVLDFDGRTRKVGEREKVGPEEKPRCSRASRPSNSIRDLVAKLTMVVRWY